ncbi:MAG TPA: hypothetical protein VFA81_04120 [Burkholderiales bacterium]|nr:hypothetical protein [Burkholderiales bacterium]
MSQQQGTSLQDEIDAGQRVKNFLADPAVEAALKAASERAYADFRGADTNEKRTAAWALSKAVDQLRTQLQGTIDTGVKAEHQLEHDRAKQRQPRR